MQKQLLRFLLAVAACVAPAVFLGSGAALSADRPSGGGAPSANPGAGEDPARLLRQLGGFLQGPRAKLLILGTFHFEDAGLDDYKPQHSLDVLSEGRQEEIEEIVSTSGCYSGSVPTSRTNPGC